MSRLRILVGAVFAISVLLSGSLAAQQLTAAEKQALLDLKSKFGPGSSTIESLNGAISIGRDEILYEGKNAREFVNLLARRGGFTPDAVVFKLKGPSAASFVTYERTKTGHVEMEDWERELQPDGAAQQRSVMCATSGGE